MTSVLLECQPGDDGGLDQLFNLLVYHSSSSQLHTNTTSTSPLFMIKNLDAGSQFNLVIQSVNAKGKSDVVSLIATTLSPPERHITGTIIS